jgi:hypothetical protein
MTSDVRYEIKTELKLRYLFSDMKHWLKNPGRSRTTTDPGSWLIW